ncbi:MAG: family 20 glycosylhydrolase, partial [Gammaproteobacteria bacterium]|nr:family 20 glycosylhydrolase [Gammaproteobacteria bacterium]
MSMVAFRTLKFAAILFSPAGVLKISSLDSLLPKPKSLTATGGRYVLESSAVEVGGKGAAVSGKGAAVARGRAVEVAQALSRRLGSLTGLPAGQNPVYIGIAAADEKAAVPQLGTAEAYHLEIDGNGVSITGNVERSLATLVQLVDCDAEGFYLPHVSIDDEPRFPWRGLMLDVARHFIGLDALYRTLEGMAFVKLNVLHLHLTDDQAFRFGSRAYPELAEGAPHYTMEDLAALVRAAAANGIRVVPELDMPAHTTSWLIAHPEWGFGKRVAPSRRFGVHQACLDPASDDVLRAVTTLLEEVAEVFPDDYVHFGGDEVNSAWWSEAGIEDIENAQAAFNKKVIRILGTLGKKPVGWDEVLHASLPAGTVVQGWRGTASRDAVLGAGFDCIFSAPYYLDLMYPADVHYGYDPEMSAQQFAERQDAALRDPRFAHVREGIEWGSGLGRFEDAPTGGAGRILGGEACLWTELVNDELLDVRLWSRLPAIAERLWSRSEVTDSEDMYR